MEIQVDELDTMEIEMEDIEAGKNFEGSVDHRDMKSAIQKAKSPIGQKNYVKFVIEEE